MPVITVYRNEFLTNVFTNIYLWLVVLSAFGISKKYLNFNNKFTNYMSKNNFSFYVLHYTIELLIAFILVEYVKFEKFILNYMFLFLGTVITLPIITEIMKKIPVINKLVLGINKGY